MDRRSVGANSTTKGEHMKVTLTATLEGKIDLDVTAEIDTFADLAKLGKKMGDKVIGVKRALPDLASKKVEKFRVAVE